MRVGLKLNIQETRIMVSSPITSWQINGETVEIVADFIFLGSKITADGDCSHEIKTLTPWKESYDKPRQCIKKKRHYFDNKCPFGQLYGFSNSQVWMWELDHKEGQMLKTDAFELWFGEASWGSLGLQGDQTSQSILNILKEILKEYSKGNQF